MTTNRALEYVRCMIGTEKGHPGYLDSMLRADPRRLEDCITEIPCADLQRWAGRNLRPAANRLVGTAANETNSVEDFRRRVEQLREYLHGHIQSGFVEFEAATEELVAARGKPMPWTNLKQKFNPKGGRQTDVLLKLHANPQQKWSVSALRDAICGKGKGSRDTISNHLRDLLSRNLAEKVGDEWRLGKAAWD